MLKGEGIIDIGSFYLFVLSSFFPLLASCPITNTAGWKELDTGSSFEMCTVLALLPMIFLSSTAVRYAAVVRTFVFIFASADFPFYHSLAL